MRIEGDPASPVSRGRLCLKGSALRQLTTVSARHPPGAVRRPHGTDWEHGTDGEPLDLETAMDMVADRVIRTRRETWEWTSARLAGAERFRPGARSLAHAEQELLQHFRRRVLGAPAEFDAGAGAVHQRQAQDGVEEVR